MNVDILKVLDISTGHLTNEQVNKLIPESEMLTSFDTGYGLIVLIPSFLQGDAEGDLDEEVKLRREIGDQPVSIMKWAMSTHDCWAVNFDADANIYRHFEVFEW